MGVHVSLARSPVFFFQPRRFFSQCSAQAPEASALPLQASLGIIADLDVASFKQAMREQFTFRSAILLGGVHKACIAGKLVFKRTIYYHLMDAVRSLNNFLSTNEVDSRGRFLCMNLVAAVAVVEVRLRSAQEARLGIPWVVARTIVTRAEDISRELLHRSGAHEWACGDVVRVGGPRT